MTLTDRPRASAGRTDLRAELNALARFNVARKNVAPDLSGGDFWIPISMALAKRGGFDGLARSTYCPDGSVGVVCKMPRDLFLELLEHERRYGRLPVRKPGDAQCACGAELPMPGYRRRVCSECAFSSGAVVLDDNSWPFCADCLLPFVTMLGGRTRIGTWVERIEDGADLCGCCWLAEHYNGDAEKMVEHVLSRSRTSDRDFAAFEFGRRGKQSRDQIFDDIALMPWSEPGLWELLRLHRISLTTAATFILRRARGIVSSLNDVRFHAGEVEAAIAARRPANG